MSTLTSFPPTLLTLAWVSMTAVGLAWMATLAMRKKSAALRHFLWLLALAAPLMALPLVWLHARVALPILPPSLAQNSITAFPFENQSVLPPSILSKTGPTTAQPTPSAPVLPDAPRSTVPAFNLWADGWFLGGAFILLRIFFSQMRVRRLVKEGCSPAPEDLLRRLEVAKMFFKFERSVRLMTTALTEVPFCYGIFRPVIIFPESWREWDEEKTDLCLTHELAHLVRHDLSSMAVSQAACILCWFNPLVWLASGRLRDEAENAADNLVLAGNVRPETYAANLVAITEKYRASSLSPTMALSMARPNRLKARVEAILDSSLFRHTPSLRAFFCISFLAACALIAALSVRLTAEPTTLSNAGPSATASTNPPAAAHNALDQALIGVARDGRTDKIGKGDADKIASLLAQGADPNARDANGTTALTWALNFGKDDGAVLLLQHGADGSVEDANGENEAWLAAKIYYCPNALDWMIKKGVQVTGLNKQGKSIFSALTSARPAAPNKWNYLHDRAWTEAEYQAWLEREHHTVDFLIAAGVDFNGKEGFQTPLMSAIKSGHYEMARALVDHGAKLDLKDDRRNVAMGYFFLSGTRPLPLDLLETMFKHGCDPNAPYFPYTDGPPQQSSYLTAVISEASIRSPQQIANHSYPTIIDEVGINEAVHLLVDHGANPAFKDAQGETPLTLARKRLPECVSSLETSTANFSK